MSRVLVAMSGGVDSSVTAALLKQDGHDVTGVTMCFNLPNAETRRPSCCGLQGIEDARRVAHALDIPHYVLGFSEVLEDKVIAPFCKAYLRGLTPNPCVWCNEHVKFTALLAKARAMDFPMLATGHYARIGQQDGLFHLLKGLDTRKDQSYFLYRIGQEQMRHIMFPIGGLTKPRIRELARECNLPVAEKADSQEICFLPDDDYRGFIARQAADNASLDNSLLQPGEIVDIDGTVLGMHKGAAYHTIGQRGGLGIAKGHPLYVLRIDAAHNRLVVGTRDQAYSSNFSIADLHWCGAPIENERNVTVKIRYNHAGVSARVTMHNERALVHCDEPVFAVAPGQSAVFYDGDDVIGGGMISEGNR